MEIMQVDVDSIIPNPNNCRVHTPENIDLIKKSLNAFDQYKPLVVQKSTRVILVGNGTYMAARELGWRTVGIVLADVDDATAEVMCVVDNRTAELSKWDMGLLKDIVSGMTLNKIEEFEFDADFINSLNDLCMEPVSTGSKKSKEPKPKVKKQTIVRCPDCGNEFHGGL